MNLGKALVKELNLDPGVDTLGRWMAHYIAEQITVAERATGVEKKEAEERCFNTILKVWRHRSAIPGESRPFVKFEPILRTLERLDPEIDHHYFFEDRIDNFESVPDELKEWLEVAKGIDEAARVCLKYVFKQAALAATDESTIEWLENAAALREEDHFSVIFRELHVDIEDFEDVVVQKDRDKLYSNIKKLEAFAKFNQMLLTEFRLELEKVVERE
ncbi:hypothetical protein [Bacillus sp. FJAT-27251]|uniref:hypothetical protein n=1 Tax=Bacillus sp. FJAT-27251 TaxID=1684142 RepID=UPI0006A7599B|nr:hypothetical protein [Bacillus sp. FJAT-27251]